MTLTLQFMRSTSHNLVRKTSHVLGLSLQDPVFPWPRYFQSSRAAHDRLRSGIPLTAKPSPLVICGPSGAGKSVLIRKLQEVFPNQFDLSVSHTTRAPRPGEEGGRDYHFSDVETIKRGVAEGKFVESAEVHGNMYGTSKAAVEIVRQSGRVCILDIDVQGARSIHEQQVWPDTRFIFIKPPSLAELERRLRARGTETEETMQVRLGNAMREIDFSDRVSFFDHRFVLDGLAGDKVPTSVKELLLLLKTWYPTLTELPPDLQL